MSYNEQLRCDYLTTNHEGAIAWRMTPEWALYTAVVTMMGVEDKFYERGNDRVRRVASLVRKLVSPAALKRDMVVDLVDHLLELTRVHSVCAHVRFPFGCRIVMLAIMSVIRLVRTLRKRTCDEFGAE